MNDQPQSELQTLPISLCVGLGIAAGIAIALSNPLNWRFGLECVGTGAFYGLTCGVVLSAVRTGGKQNVRVTWTWPATPAGWLIAALSVGSLAVGIATLLIAIH